MTNVQVNNKIYQYAFISKTNVDIIYITVSMWKQYIFEIIFNSDDVLNIQDYTRKLFGSREIALSMGVNAYFGPRRKQIPHATPNYVPG